MNYKTKEYFTLFKHEEKYAIFITDVCLYEL